MKTSNKLGLVMLLIAMVFGCSAITDFDMPEDSDTGTGTDTEDTDITPYSIDDALADGTVNVTLQSDDNAVFSLELDPPVPEVEGGDSELEAMLSDGTIMIVVINDETSTNFSLSDGILVDDVPDDSGEYQVVLSSDRQTLDVIFTNDFNGSSVVAGGDYSTLISVQSNPHSFEIESFSRDVEVSE